jgi:Lon-like ATP-dependent protease
MGTLIEIEVCSHRVAPGQGQLQVTGVVEEEEMGNSRRVIRRKSMAKGSVENVLTVLRDYLDESPRDFDIHINFPGGVPIDGPSAGIAIATAIYSSLTGIPVLNTVAMTGEISVRGYVRPVGGVVCKVAAARQAGAKSIIVPSENWQYAFQQVEGIKVVAVNSLHEVLEHALVKGYKGSLPGPRVLTASPM